ncbi:hypothetical protein [Acidovorax sp.]|uniref:hypothetical protein n=1 Tax=Acidovorax sp. TaxID=1872122 RepID=UPI00391F0550
MLRPIFGNDRPAPDVQTQPHVELRHWRIVQRINGKLHIVAQLASGSFRLTTMLVAIDLHHATVRTESGRCYHLCAPPEEDEFLRSAMDACTVRGLAFMSGDVSEIIWTAITSGTWSRDEGDLLPPL